MSIEILSSKHFADNEEVPEKDVEGEGRRIGYSEFLAEALEKAFTPIKAMNDLMTTMNPGENWPNAMERDIALVYEALTQKAEADLREWEQDMERNLGRVAVVRGVYNNDEVTPEAPLGVKVLKFREKGGDND